MGGSLPLPARCAVSHRLETPVLLKYCSITGEVLSTILGLGSGPLGKAWLTTVMEGSVMEQFGGITTVQDPIS